MTREILYAHTPPPAPPAAARTVRPPEPQPEHGPAECATPDCHNPAGHGLTRLFCQPCADRLAVHRDRAKAQAKRDQRRIMRGSPSPTLENDLPSIHPQEGSRK